MSSIIWYRFSGCCNGEVFQVQASTPPASFNISEFYYLQTDTYVGCSTLLGTGFTSGVHTYNLINYDGTNFIDCTDCQFYYPCIPQPTQTQSSISAPTRTPTSTATPTKTPVITPAPTNTPSVTTTSSVTPTPTITKTSTCQIYQVSLVSVSGGNFTTITNLTNFSLFVTNGNQTIDEFGNQLYLTILPSSGSTATLNNSSFTSGKIGVATVDSFIDCVTCYSLQTLTYSPCDSPNPTQTPSFSPTSTKTPTNSTTPTKTPTNSTTPTNTVTPSITPTNTVTPSITPTNTVTPSITPSNTPTKTPPLTPIPSIGPTSTPTNSNTPTLTITPSPTSYTSCTQNSYCFFTNLSSYTQYNGIFYNYEGTIHNGKSVFYCSDCQTPSFIYYNSGETRWCLSEIIDGNCILFGQSNNSTICPDLSSSFLLNSCPTPTPSYSVDCVTFDFNASFYCILPSTSSTPTPSPTNTLTPSITSSGVFCSGKYVIVNGVNFNYQQITPTPSVTSINNNQYCLILSSVTYNIFTASFTSSFAKVLRDCQSSVEYVVNGTIPFSTGATFNAIINGVGVCVTYVRDVFSPGIDYLLTIQSGNFFNCDFCIPLVTPTQTPTPSITPTISPTISITPSSTPCQNVNIDYTFLTSTGFNVVSDMYKIKRVSDGNYLVAGNFTSYNSNSAKRLVKISQTGVFISSFDTSNGFDLSPTDFVEQEDGKIIVVGLFSEYSGVSSGYICRLNSDATIDNSFQSTFGFNSYVNSVDLQSDGKILVGGNFSKYSGISCNYICRLNTDGTFDYTFNSGGTGFDATIKTLKVLSDDSIVCSGFFSSYNGISWQKIIKLNYNGSIDYSFGDPLGLNNNVLTMTVTSNEDIYLSGYFNQFGGYPITSGILKMSNLGVVDYSFNSNVGSGILPGYSTSISEDLYGDIILFLQSGNTFNNYNFHGIVKISSSGIINNQINTYPGFNGTVTSSLVDSNNKIISIGNFSSFNNINKNGIVRLYPCMNSITTPTPTPTSTLSCPQTGKYLNLLGEPSFVLSDNINQYTYISYFNYNSLSIYSSYFVNLLNLSLGGPAYAIAYDNNLNYIYIPEYSTGVLNIFDLSTLYIIQTISIPTPSTINDIVIDYVNNLICLLDSSNNQIHFIDTTTFTFLSSLTIPNTVGGKLTIDYKNSELYVSNSSSYDTYVYIINTNDLSSFSSIYVGTGDNRGLIYNPVNNYVYVLDYNYGFLWYINTNSKTVDGYINLTYNTDVLNLTYDSNKNYIYVATNLGKEMIVVDCVTNTQIPTTYNIISDEFISNPSLNYTPNNGTIWYGLGYLNQISYLCTNYVPVPSLTPTSTPLVSQTPTSTPTPSATLPLYCPYSIINISLSGNVTSFHSDTYNNYTWVTDTGTTYYFDYSYSFVGSDTSISGTPTSMSFNSLYNRMYVAAGDTIYSYDVTSYPFSPQPISMTTSGGSFVDVKNNGNYIVGLDSSNNYVQVYDGLFEYSQYTITGVTTTSGKSTFDTYYNLLYVCNGSNSDVFVVSPSSGVTILALTVGTSYNLDIIYQPALNYIYVLENNYGLWYIDSFSYNVLGSIPLSFTNNITKMSFDPGKNYIYVSSNFGQELITVDTISNTQISSKYVRLSSSGETINYFQSSNDTIWIGNNLSTNFDILCTDVTPVYPTLTPTNTSTITPTNTSTNTPTPSVTPTNTPTPSITPTNTITPTNSLTPTVTPTIPYCFGTCDIFYLSSANTIRVYNFSADTSTGTLITNTGFTATALAFTSTKLWTCTHAGTTINEWTITLCPFTSSFSRNISAPFPLSSAMFAIDNNRLIIGRQNVLPERIYELNISGTPTSTLICTLPMTRRITEMSLNTNGKLIILGYNAGAPTNRYVTQIDYVSGNLELDYQISPTINNPYGIFEYSSELYLLDGLGSSNYYKINTSTYSLTLSGNVGTGTIYGMQQQNSCLTAQFTPNVTPTPTSTTTPTATPTATVTPTLTTTPTPTSTPAPPVPFISIWTAASPIELPYVSGGTYTGTIDWGDGNVSANTYANRTHTYASSGDYTITIQGTIEGWSFALNPTYKDSIREIIQWGTLKGESNSNSYMFAGCTNLVLTGVTGTPDLSTIYYLNGMFNSCTSITTINNISSWDISGVNSLYGMFSYSSNFNDDLSSWDTSNIVTFANMFQGCTSYNNLGQPLDSWNTSSLQYLSDTFAGASSFNASISGWDVSNVFTFVNAFNGASSFDQDLGSWDLASATDVSYMFANASLFNNGGITSISGWNVSNVQSTIGMFNNCTLFNQPIGSWDVSNVQDMSFMFAGASSFNQNINSWNTSNVQSMTQMFDDCTSFNQPLSGWDVSIVTDMSNMFCGASSFNQNINNWNVSNVTDMSSMFLDCSSFNQPLSGWVITNVITMSFMLDNTSVDVTNYSNILTSWASQVPSIQTNVDFGASNLYYDCGVQASKDILTDSLTYKWTITDSGCIVQSPTPTPTQTSTVTPTVSVTPTITTTPTITQTPTNTSTPTVTPTNTSTPTVTPTITPSQSPYPTTAFISRWATTTSNETVTLPYLISGTYSGTIYWGDGSTSANTYANRTKTFASPGTYTIVIDGTVTGFQFNFGGDRTKIREILQWGNVRTTTTSNIGMLYGCTNLVLTGVTDTPNLSGITSLQNMLRSCTSLTTVNNINSWNLSGVTSLSGMFYGAINFNDTISGWNVSNVTTFTDMFRDARDFNQPIGNWNVSSATNLGRMFYGQLYSTSFNQPLSGWNTSNNTTLQQMFAGNPSFNQPIGNWNTSAVTNMSSIFYIATSFNQPLSGWNTSNVTSMDYLFAQSNFDQNINNWDVSNVTNFQSTFANTPFNQPLSGWNVSAATNMYGMFSSADNFNQNINNWDVSNVTNMYSMFSNTLANTMQFNQPLSGWNVSKVQLFYRMFKGCSGFNQNIGNWNTSAATTMFEMFRSTSFNNGGSPTISGWNVSNVTDMSAMFLDSDFNQPIGIWNVSKVTSMNSMFYLTPVFNQDIGSWDVSKVQNMSVMFGSGVAAPHTFNNGGSPSISAWTTSAVTNMTSMFASNYGFNQDIGNWNVSKVSDFTSMFIFSSFNNGGSPSISGWTTSAATEMDTMFYDNNVFNQPIGSWDVSKVTDMNGMFQSANGFNQPLSGWNVSKVTNMNNMFLAATSFNQDLGNWNVSGVTSFGRFIDGSAISKTNYDSLLVGWSSQNLKPNITFQANRTYSPSPCAGGVARASIISNYGWTFQDDIAGSCP